MGLLDVHHQIIPSNTLKITQVALKLTELQMNFISMTMQIGASHSFVGTIFTIVEAFVMYLLVMQHFQFVIGFKLTNGALFHDLLVDRIEVVD